MRIINLLNTQPKLTRHLVINKTIYPHLITTEPLHIVRPQINGLNN